MHTPFDPCAVSLIAAVGFGTPESWFHDSLCVWINHEYYSWINYFLLWLSLLIWWMISNNSLVKKKKWVGGKRSAASITIWLTWAAVRSRTGRLRWPGPDNRSRPHRMHRAVWCQSHCRSAGIALHRFSERNGAGQLNAVRQAISWWAQIFTKTSHNGISYNEAKIVIFVI